MRLEYWVAGHFERDDKYVFAVCDRAPLVSHGADENEALARMRDAAHVYVKTLIEAGELDAALKAGWLSVEPKLKDSDHMMTTAETTLFETRLAAV